MNAVLAWDNDDLEIFDLVELINQNFYELMGINTVSKIITWNILFNSYFQCLHFRRHISLKSKERSETYQLFCILIKTLLKTQTYNLGIWFLFMRF